MTIQRPFRVRTKPISTRNPAKDKSASWKRAGTARRARLRELPSEPYTEEQITEEHGTICYLCWTEINLELPAADPAGAVIEHVIPLTDLACPGDILENVRWTHNECNEVKGYRRLEELHLPFFPPYTLGDDLDPIA